MNKTYLDETDFNSVVKEFISGLSPDFKEGTQVNDEAEAIECRSRDGFIPHSHNHGGFDLSFLTHLGIMRGTGYSVGSVDPEYAEKENERAHDGFYRDCKEKLEGISRENLDYHWLCENGHDDLAEELDEYVMEWLDDCDVWYGYRAMYEGSEDGVHTLVVYAGTNEDKYYGHMGNGSTVECEKTIEFKNVFDLKKQLDAVKKDLEAAL